MACQFRRQRREGDAVGEADIRSGWCAETRNEQQGPAPGVGDEIASADDMLCGVGFRIAPERVSSVEEAEREDDHRQCGDRDAKHQAGKQQARAVPLPVAQGKPARGHRRYSLKEALSAQVPEQHSVAPGFGKTGSARGFE